MREHDWNCVYANAKAKKDLRKMGVLSVKGLVAMCEIVF